MLDFGGTMPVFPLRGVTAPQSTFSADPMNVISNYGLHYPNYPSLIACSNGGSEKTFHDAKTTARAWWDSIDNGASLALWPMEPRTLQPCTNSGVFLPHVTCIWKARPYSPRWLRYTSFTWRVRWFIYLLEIASQGKSARVTCGDVTQAPLTTNCYAFRFR